MMSPPSVALMKAKLTPAARAALRSRPVEEPMVAAFCSSEPDAGSDVGAIRTRAVYDEAPIIQTLAPDVPERIQAASGPISLSP